jgi:hypothetical protein
MSMSLTSVTAGPQAYLTSHYKGVDSTTYDYGVYGVGGINITGAGALGPTTAFVNYGGASLTGTVTNGVIQITGGSEPAMPPPDDPQAYNIAVASLNAKFNDAVTASTEVNVTFTSIFQGTASAGASIAYRLEVYPLGNPNTLVDIRADAVSQTVTLYQGIPYVVSLLDVFSVPGKSANTGTSLSTTASALYAYTVAEVDSHGTPIPGNPDLTFDSGLTHISIACYAAGTRIATPHGEIAVDRLTPGTLVTAHFAGTAEIVWIGHRHVDCRRHPDPARVMPIRVRAHAFGPDQPHRDLVLSPDHAVFAAGVLMPIRYLVNGATIARMDVEAITYWHVELDRHDVVLAEGLPTESYLDTGNRSAFDDVHVAVQLHPDFALRIRETEACAPLCVAGADLAQSRRRLHAQALALGWRLSPDPDIAKPDGGDGDRAGSGVYGIARLP